MKVDRTVKIDGLLSEMYQLNVESVSFFSRFTLAHYRHRCDENHTNAIYYAREVDMRATHQQILIN